MPIAPSAPPQATPLTEAQITQICAVLANAYRNQLGNAATALGVSAIGRRDAIKILQSLVFKLQEEAANAEF